MHLSSLLASIQRPRAALSAVLMAPPLRSAAGLLRPASLLAIGEPHLASGVLPFRPAAACIQPAAPPLAAASTLLPPPHHRLLLLLPPAALPASKASHHGVQREEVCQDGAAGAAGAQGHTPGARAALGCVLCSCDPSIAQPRADARSPGPPLHARSTCGTGRATSRAPPLPTPAVSVLSSFRPSDQCPLL